MSDTYEWFRDAYKHLADRYENYRWTYETWYQAARELDRLERESNKSK